MLNTTSDISFRTQGYCRARFLEEGQMAGMIFERFGQADPQPKNESKTAKWRRIHNLPVSAAKAPLAEGIAPSGTRITYEDVTGTLEQIGAWIPLTDVLLNLHEDNKNNRFHNHLMKLCGRQAAEVKEERRADVLKAGSNVVYAGGVTARASVAAVVDRDDFRLVNRTFMRNRASKITSIIKASSSYATQAIEPAFVAVCHPDLADTIRDITGFVHWSQYADSGKRLPGEIGAVESVRVCEHDVVRPWTASGSSGGTAYLSGGVASTGSNSYDVYPIICLAENAYGIVPLQNVDDVEILIRNPKAEKGNELAQEGSIGWKAWDLTVRLNESFMCRIETCAKAL